MKDDDTKELDPGDMKQFLANAENWICTGLDCGKRPFDGGYAVWRWDGKTWQHYHGYPTGHLVAKYKPIEKKPK